MYFKLIVTLKSCFLHSYKQKNIEAEQLLLYCIVKRAGVSPSNVYGIVTEQLLLYCRVKRAGVSSSNVYDIVAEQLLLYCRVKRAGVSPSNVYEQNSCLYSSALRLLIASFDCCFLIAQSTEEPSYKIITPLLCLQISTKPSN